MAAQPGKHLTHGMLPTTTRRVLTGLLATAAGTLALGATAHAARIVTPDVAGYQRVLVVGCDFHDTWHKGLLELANPGIERIGDDMHDYFDTISNHRVNLQATFAGWHGLPQDGDFTQNLPDGGTDAGDHDRAVHDCKQLANDQVTERGLQPSDYRAIVMLFNRDIGMSNEMRPDLVNQGRYVHLRYEGGTGGGWTSPAVWRTSSATRSDCCTPPTPTARSRGTSTTTTRT